MTHSLFIRIALRGQTIWPSIIDRYIISFCINIRLVLWLDVTKPKQRVAVAC